MRRSPSGRPAYTWAPASSTNPAWHELNTREPDGALAFYASVFGWEGRTTDFDAEYTELRLGDAGVAGMLDMRSRVPDGVPPHWLTYIAVEDCDASVAEVTDLEESR